MRQIIDGKLYNTETAECIGDWYSGHSFNDFRYAPAGETHQMLKVHRFQVCRAADWKFESMFRHCHTKNPTTDILSLCIDQFQFPRAIIGKIFGIPIAGKCHGNLIQDLLRGGRGSKTDCSRWKEELLH